MPEPSEITPWFDSMRQLSLRFAGHLNDQKQINRLNSQGAGVIRLAWELKKVYKPLE